jgi:hypothetical protein
MAATSEQRMQEEIRNAAGERLDTTWHAGGGGRGPVLVLGHGVTANKDRPFLVTLAEAASAAGLDVLRFSFAGNGGSEGRFEEATVTKEAGDLRAVLDALAARQVIYAGHSMGAAVGALTAARDARIGRLISLGGMVHTAAFVERKFAGLVPGRDRMWEKPDCPLSQAFLDDMREVGSVQDLAAAIRVPWLLVHGTADTVVPPEESVELARQDEAARTLELLEGADHVFSDGADADMARVVLRWLEVQGVVRRGASA